MMYKIFIGVLIVCFSIGLNQIHAQNIRKKTELNYRFTTDNDSFIQHVKTFEYDRTQRIISGNEQYFSGQANKTLNKEVFMNFDSANMLMSEKINKYNKDLQETERLKTKYFIYSADERNNKYLSRQFYDNMDELMKEDTLVYDKNNNLLSRCEYDYRGSTSQFCDVYDYNKKNQLKRWRMYIYWTTVNIAAKPITQKAKRQDYRYTYNQRGQPLSSKGKRYSAFFKENYTYDREGRLASYTQKKTRIIKPSKKKTTNQNKTENVKATKMIDLIVRKYNHGKLVFEQLINNNIEIQRSEIKYLNDTLALSQVIFSKGIKIKEIDFEYGPLDRLTMKVTKNFDDKGNLRSTVKNLYNEKGQLTGEFNFVKDILMSEVLFTYDDFGRTTYIAQYLKTKTDFYRKYEATFFLYDNY